MSMTPLLEVSGVSRFFGGLTALENVSFEIHEGEIVGLVGPNGSGKSVLLDIISGLLRTSLGAIFLRTGQQLVDLTKLEPQGISRHGVARTFQDSRVFERLTVLENVLLGFDARMKKEGRPPAEKEREREGVSLTNLLGGRLAPFKNEWGGALSFANRRRVEILRVLASRPILALFDEPSAGMNPAETVELARELGQELRRRSIAAIVVEHKLNFLAPMVDRVLALDGGRLVRSLAVPLTVRSVTQL